MNEGSISHELRVRYNECDAQGIVFNANWFVYFDAAMTEFWRETIGGYQHVPTAYSIEVVVAETGARFRGAARFDDVVNIVPKLRRVGTSSMRVEFDALRGDDLLVEGFIECVFVDANAMQPTPIPDGIRNMLPTADLLGG
ncbi:MAG: acyl-CoA thioesterase [Solirubrobacterales bacterium]